MSTTPDLQTRELVSYIWALASQIVPDNQVRISVIHSLELLGLDDVTPLPATTPLQPPYLTMGAPLAQAMPPAPSPLMAMLSAPLPGKAGPDSLYPDPVLTPGATNPAVTQETIATTIAVPNWTSTIRPPVSVTGPMKLASMKAYGFTDSPSNYEYDHLISLELGGAPDDPRNIWPQRHADATHDIGSQQKDKLENALKRQVVSGQLTLLEAQTLICTDWYAAYLNLNKMGMIPMTVAYDPSGSDDDDDNA